MVSEIVKPSMVAYHGHAHPGAPSIEHGLVLKKIKWPKLFQAGGMPVVRIHARFEQFPTKYASCDTSYHLVAFFNQEKSRKDQICRKPKQLGMVRLIGHIRSWKDLGWVNGCRKNMPSTGPFSLTWTPSVEHDIFLDMHEMTPTFSSRRACPW